MTTTKVSLNLHPEVQYVARYWDLSRAEVKTIIVFDYEVRALLERMDKPFGGVADVRVWELDTSDLKPVIL